MKNKLYLDENNNLLEEQKTTKQSIGIVELNMKFFDVQHKQKFLDVINRMSYADCYHLAVAYLITLDTVCRQHIDSLYDFEEQCIITEGLNKSWQTDTSKKTTRLAFNLWNGCHSDGETYTDKDGYTTPLPSRFFAVDEIFSCSYAPFYFESIKLRFPENFR